MTIARESRLYYPGGPRFGQIQRDGIAGDLVQDSWFAITKNLNHAPSILTKARPQNGLFLRNSPDGIARNGISKIESPLGRDGKFAPPGTESDVEHLAIQRDFFMTASRK